MGIGDALTQLLETIALMLIHSDRVLQTPRETHVLVYELVHETDALHAMAPLIGTAQTSAPHWTLIQQVLQAFAVQLEQWREQSATSRISLFRTSAANRVPSTSAVMHMIASLDLATMLHPESPQCVAIIRGAQARGTRGATGVPSPSASQLRCLQQDILARGKLA